MLTVDNVFFVNKNDWINFQLCIKKFSFLNREYVSACYLATYLKNLSASA